jgi:hypothetical protein
LCSNRAEAKIKKYQKYKEMMCLRWALDKERTRERQTETIKKTEGKTHTQADRKERGKYIKY